MRCDAMRYVTVENSEIEIVSLSIMHSFIHSFETFSLSVSHNVVLLHKTTEQPNTTQLNITQQRSSTATL